MPRQDVTRAVERRRLPGVEPDFAGADELRDLGLVEVDRVASGEGAEAHREVIPVAIRYFLKDFIGMGNSVGHGDANPLP